MERRTFVKRSALGMGLLAVGAPGRILRAGTAGEPPAAADALDATPDQEQTGDGAEVVKGPMEARVINASEAATFGVLGLPHSILVEQHETPSGYEIVQITGAVGAGVPPHVHESEDETFYVAEGEAAFVLDGREVVAPAGSAANLPRGIPHGFRITRDDTRLLLTISPGGLAPMFRELAQLPPGEPDLAAIAGICEKFGIRFI